MAKRGRLERKIGEGHASAMVRTGFSELRNLTYSDSNIAKTQEYGLFGTLTPGEVAEARRSDEREFEEEAHSHSVLSGKLKEAEQCRGHEPQEPEMER